MLDIKFIRKNPEIVKEGAKKKHIDVDIDQLLYIDEERLLIQKEVEELKSQQSAASKRIASAKSEGEKQAVIDSMQSVKDELVKKEGKLRDVKEAWNELMLQVPSVPDVSVPEGEDDYDNVEFKTWGEKTFFDFDPEDHISLMKKHDMVDFERGAKVHGFRGYYLKNAGVRLSFAIWNYALDFFLAKGFVPFIAPSLAKRENFFGTGHLPNEADDMYETQDGDFFSGTSEVTMMGFHSGEVLDSDDFPIKYLSFSPAYRREAGSYGKDTKGLIRVHEFYKWEQVVLCEADHAKEVELHEWINRNTEEFIESLKIPYRTVINCGGDLGQGQVKKYDIELWVPKEKKYREISSASYFHDFQTRRFNIRYKDNEGNMQFAHSLNCTAIPTPRILVSLIENFQDNNGNIEIPQVLRPYFGNDAIE
jgi:seryl-tRNA synthetase